MIIDPKTITFQEAYKILIGSVLPRPIAFVSTVNAEGINNLAPFSFFTIAASNPPTLVFCPLRKSATGEKKDTLRNIEAIGEYVVNIVSEDFVVQMNQTAEELPHDMDEFVYSGLNPISSVSVKPPRVSESPISFECKLNQLVPVGNDGPGGGTIVIGEIIQMHIKDDVISNYRISAELIKPLGRMAGNFYCRTTDLFELDRK